jgi:hypothetical protein
MTNRIVVLPSSTYDAEEESLKLEALKSRITEREVLYKAFA